MDIARPAWKALIVLRLLGRRLPDLLSMALSALVPSSSACLAEQNSFGAESRLPSLRSLALALQQQLSTV